MEKANTKSAFKFVRNTTSQSAAQWSSSAYNTRRMTKDKPKEKLHDNNKASRKSPTKEKSSPKGNTKPQEFKLHTQERAVKRAMFNYEVTTKLDLMEQQKKVQKKLLKRVEEEETRLLRKEMVPRAQLMPYFDRPFFPQRSSRRLTIPREPSFHMVNSTCWSCLTGGEFYNNFQNCGHQILKPIIN